MYMEADLTDKRSVRKLRKSLERRMIAAGMKIVLFTDTQVLQFLRGILKREFKATDMEIQQMVKNPVVIPAGLEVYWIRKNPTVAYIIDTEAMEEPAQPTTEVEAEDLPVVKKKGKK